MSRRLHVPAKILSYQRGRHIIHPNFSLLEIKGCTSNGGAKYYLGKTVYYIYRVKRTLREKSGVRIIRGKVTKTHGNSGVVRARFARNIPSHAFGKPCRVMLYPQH